MTATGGGSALMFAIQQGHADVASVLLQCERGMRNSVGDDMVVLAMVYNQR